MPQEQLAGDGNEVRRSLLSMGLKLGEDKQAKDLLIRYLLSCHPIDRVRTVNSMSLEGRTHLVIRDVNTKEIGTRSGGN